MKASAGGKRTMENLIPAELRSLSLKDWQLNVTTITIGLMVLGRAWRAWRDGGGLMGVWNGFMYGTNTPRATITTNTNENITS